MKKYKLGEICTIVPGYAFKATDFGKGLNYVIKIKDIMPPYIDILHSEKVETVIDKKYEIKYGDFVMAMTGATIGKIGKLQIDSESKVYINQRVCKFIPEAFCDKEYLYYKLNTQEFQQFIYNNVDSKLAQPNIGHPTIYKYELELPLLSEQRRIGQFLKAIDDKIALNRSINHNLEAMAKQLYDYWFVQFDFPDENGKPYKSSGGKMVWNEKLKREIPEGWDDVILNDFLIIKNGRDHKLLATGNYPVYGSGGEMRRVSAYLYNGEAILMPRKGSLNNIMYVNKAFWTVDTMFYSEMKIPNCAKYVFFAIKDIDFTRWDSGTGVPSMTASLLYSIPLVKPNDLILQIFDNVLLPIFQKLEKVQLENENLTKLRDSLLPLLMNGQVSVNYDLSND